MSDKILTPDTVRKYCRQLAAQPLTIYSREKWGAIIGHFNKALKQYTADGKDAVDQNRRLVFSFLFAREDKPFNELSSSELSPSQRYAIGRWVGAAKDDQSGEWKPRVTWVNELYWILSVSLWLHTITLAAALKDEKAIPIFAEVYAMYRAEEKVNDVLDPGYWLDMAHSLGGVVTYIYEATPSGKIEKPAYPLPPLAHEKETQGNWDAWGKNGNPY